MAWGGFGGGGSPKSSSSKSGGGWGGFSGGGSSGGGGGGLDIGDAIKNIGGDALSLVGKTLKGLDAPRAALIALARQQARLFTGQGIDLDEAVAQFRRREGIGDLIANANLPGGINTKRALGFVGDVLTDPLTYVTLGVGTGAKMAAQAGGKAARVTAEDAARRLISEGSTEAAERVLKRRSVNALTAEEAARLGIRQGPTVLRRAALPGGDVAARAVSDVAAPLTEALHRLPLGGRTQAASKGLSKVDAFKLKDAERQARLLAKGMSDQAKSRLGQALKAAPNLDKDALREALEGAAEMTPEAASLRSILDDVAAQVEELTGLHVPRIENYLPHRLTDDVKEALAGAPRRTGGGTSAVMTRAYKPGDEFMGETLQEGSVAEMNRIAEEKGIGKLFQDDPVQLVHRYINEMRGFAQRKGVLKQLGATEAPLKEIRARGAKAAEKTARSLERGMDENLLLLGQTRQAGQELVGLAGQRAATAADLEAQVLDAYGRGTTFDGPRIGNPEIEQAANLYIQRRHLPPPTPVDRSLRVDDAFATRVAQAYDALPAVGGEDAKAAYKAFADEVEDQYDYLTKELGIRVQFVDDDPYQDAAEMMLDVRHNKTLKVYKTADDQDHPFLSREQNDKFRAVHDFFGHAQAGNRFDRHGEEVAFRLHAQMFSDDARPAMTTETRGQNAYLNYHPDNVARKALGQQAQFPEQKAALLPPEFQAIDPVPAAAKPLPTEPRQLNAEHRARALTLKAQLDKVDADLGKIDKLAKQASAQGDAIALTAVNARRVGLGREREAILEQVRELQEQTRQALRPQVVQQAQAFDHVTLAKDEVAVQAQVQDNLAKLAVAREAERAAREEADRLFAEAQQLRAAGDEDMAIVQTLRAEALKLEQDILKAHGRLGPLRQLASKTKQVRDVKAMSMRGLQELADGRFAEPWVADAVLQLDESLRPENINALLKAFDRVSAFWRSTALLSFGFHERNFMGGMFNNMLAGMPTSRYFDFARAHRAYKRGGLEAIQDVEVRNAFDAAVRLGQYTGEDISDVSRLAGAEGGGRIIGSQNPVFRANFRAGKLVERNLRMPLFIDTYIKSGGNERAALDAVDTYHFDYDDLTRLERTVGRRAFAFYTWTRKNLPLQIVNILNQPGKYTMYLKLKNNIEQGTTEDPVVPSYFERKLAIRLPFQSSGGRIYAMPELPFMNTSEALEPKSILASLNPVIKTPLEALTNHSFFEQRQYGTTLRPSPDAWGAVLTALMPLNGKFGLPKVFKAKDGTLMMTEHDAAKIDSMLPLLGRLRRLVPSEEKYQDRAFAAWFSFAFGVSIRTLDEATIGGEVKRRERILTRQRSEAATLAGGAELANFRSQQAAEERRQAAARGQ